MNHPIRRIRSFIRREGRITPSQERALKKCWDRFGLNDQQVFDDLDTVFHRNAPKILDIGFGNGQSLLEGALNNPDIDYIGVEVYRAGVGSLFIQLAKNDVSNVRVFCADAVDVLSTCIPDQSLDKVQLFFPDPWPKKRHHKRRIVQHDFCQLVLKKLKPGGVFHMATDWKEYAEHMMSVMKTVPEFDSQFVERPEDRPLTKYERRGKRLGHEVWDLIAKHLP